MSKSREVVFFLQEEDGIRDKLVTGVQTCALPISGREDFESLVRLHRPRIFRFLLASLRDREAAENLVQDCFVRAYKGRDQFRGSSSFATWLMHIAANLVRDHEASHRLKFWRSQPQ